MAVFLLMTNSTLYSRCPAGDRGEERHMPIQLEGEILISIPAGFTVDVVPSFTNETTGNALIVDQGAIPRGSRNAADIMADRRAEFEAGLGKKIEIKKEHRGVLLGREDDEIHFSFDVQGKPTYAWFAVTPISSTQYVQVSLMTSRPDDDATFEHVIASISEPDAAPVGPSKGGWIHQYAGPIALDVPANMEPPHAYSFVSADRKTHLLVNLYSPARRPPQVPPTIQQEIAEDQKYGAVISNQVSNTFVPGEGYGSLMSYVLTKKDLPENKIEVVHRSRISYPDGFVVTFMVREPQASRVELDSAFEGLVNSVQRLKH